MRWSSAEGPSLTLVSKPETLLTTKLVILLTLSGLATRLISISCPCLYIPTKDSLNRFLISSLLSTTFL